MADLNATAPVDETVLQSGDPVASFASAAISGQEPVTPAQPVAQPEGNSNVPGTYPTFYESAAKARAAGYSWQDIGEFLSTGREKALAAGYTGQEINAHLGMDPQWGSDPSPLDRAVPVIPAGENPGAVQAAATVRDFATKYMTPSFDQSGAYPPAPIRSAGDFLRMAGHDITDVGRVFGGGVVNGLAATLEMMDGKPRSTEEWSQLNAEAMNFTALLAKPGPGVRSFEPPTGPGGVKLPLPAMKDTLDAATSIVHPPEAAAVAAARDALAVPASEPSGVAAAPSMPIINMKSLELTSQEAQLKQKLAAVTERHDGITVPEDAAASRDTLAKVQVVQDQLDNPQLMGDERKTLSARKDELLADTNPEKLQESAGALDAQRQAANERDNLQSQLADVQAQQAKIQADAALAPTPNGASIATVMRNLGQNFVDTGEHPLDAAARAQTDPALMQQLQAPHPDVPQAAPAGGANTIFTDDAVAAARARLAAKSRTVSSGIDPQDFADLATIAGYHIEKGIRNFADFSAKMIADVGETVKPHLQALYDQATKAVPGRAREVGSGKPPAKGLVVAGLDDAGKIHYGEPGQTHADLADKGIDLGANGKGEMGFAGPNGRFLTREEALQSLDEADRAKQKYADEGWLEGESYNKSVGAERGIGDNGGPSLDNITPETITRPDDGYVARGIVDNLKNWFSPASRGADAGETAAILREGMAQQAQRGQMSVDNLRRFGRAVADLTPEQQAQFLHDFETGNTSHLAGTPLGEMADAIHLELSHRWAMMDDRGIAPGYIQDYLPHLYKDPEEATAKLSAYYGKKSAQGNRSFTKERTFSTFLEAAEALGLEPITTNPLELVMTHLIQADKFITAHDVVAQLKDAGLIKAMPNNLTRAESLEFAGMTGIDQSIARGTGGTWVASEPVAHILNRWLSPGLSGQPAYDMIRSAGNTINMAQLGLSGFHGGFVTFEAGANAVSKGVMQISRLSPGEIARGLGNILSAPSAPITNAIVGRKVIAQVLGRANYGPGIQTIADALIAGGGRVGMDASLQASAMGDFWGAMKSSASYLTGVGDDGHIGLMQDLKKMYAEAESVKIGNLTVLPGVVRATAQIIPRLMETAMAPLMKSYVPMMKVGGFANLMADEMRLHPDMTHSQLRDTAQSIWHSIDNRLGEMVMDNRFWNKQAQDLGVIGVRALGWTVGSIDELGGGALDVLHGRELSAAGTRQLSARASYLVGMPIMTAMTAAIFGTIAGTYNTNWGVKDYFFPPTGGKDAQGGPERASMPGYSKEVYNWATDPLGTALSKVHPLPITLLRMYNNEDWNGAALTDPRQPWDMKAQDYGSWLMQQMEPITIKGQPGQQDSGLSPFVRNLGFKPAPYAIREPEKNEAFEQHTLMQKLKKKFRADNAQ